MLKARYIMIGGFLGAGKTTAILGLAGRFSTKGQRVGLIANDQSVGLVDTTMFNSHGFATQEITGGCFCCRFNSLIEAAERLQADVRPDVLLAEPVGSCTDLVATVSLPLRQMYGEQFEVAPLSVLVDPVRAQRVLGLKQGRAFTPNIRYIYEKQLEEADLLVVNKVDLLDGAALDELTAALRARYPRASVTALSARTGEGLDRWIEMLTTQPPVSASMDLDYDTYADGEAALGWVNIAAEIAGQAIDGNDFLLRAVEEIHECLRRDGQEAIEIAHLKATLTPNQGNDIAVANLVRHDVAAELSHRLAESLAGGRLNVNLRAEGDPQVLVDSALGVLRQVADESKLSLTIQHCESFRPARPTPTYRLAGG